MCSIGEDDYGDEGGVHAMVPQSSAQAEITNEAVSCSKCGQSTDIAGVYKLSCRQPECRDCFLAYVRHKFRAALGSAKVLPRAARVLLVCDGSAEALVLLDMLHHAQTQNTFKRLHCTAQVLHIDETALQGGSSADATKLALAAEERVSQLRSLLARFEPFEAYVMSAADTAATTYSLKTAAAAYLTRDLSGEREFAARVAALRSATARQDFVKHQRSRLIAAAAAQFDCGFAFLPDISTALASQLLAAIALGRGGCAALDVALLDDRFGTVKLVRPLKDLNAAEVQLYVRAQQLSPLQESAAALEHETSLQSLTKAFVDNLQQNFASTVSTVFRTGDKMAPPAPRNAVEQQLSQLSLEDDASLAPLPSTCCAFCNSPLDYADSTTLLAIEFSRLVSEAGTTLDKCASLDADARNQLHGQVQGRRRRLCHGCRNIQAECGRGDANARLLD